MSASLASSGTAPLLAAGVTSGTWRTFEVETRKVVVTHAAFPSQNLSPEEQWELAETGAWIEHCFTTTHTGKAPWWAACDAIHRVGAQRTILSTDLGQTTNSAVPLGFAMYAQTLLDNGFGAEQVRRMAVVNTGGLVD